MNVQYRCLFAQRLLQVLSLLVVAAPFANAQYSPDHPKVQAMVDRGVAFLNSKANGQANIGGGYGLGSQALVGYAVLKATGEPELPIVKRAVEASKRLAASLASLRETGESKIVYEVCVAGVFLASLDSAKYQPELVQIREWLLEIQKPHGGFGYLGRPTGDTSQVQYVMLALWTMQQVGMDVPTGPIESTVTYLRQTMDPSGTWGYQGIIGSGRLVPQEDISKSLGTAGAGALIIAGDMLALFGSRREIGKDEDGVPAAFMRVDLLQARRERGRVELKRSDVENPLSVARRYQDTSNFNGAYWYYYWRYSQERYESFVEIVEGKQEKSPGWYNRGVEELERFQDTDGSWGSTLKRDFYPADVCTAFSVLFLIRSTQKAIGKLDEGIAWGGYSLPSSVANIKMVGNRIVSEEEASVESLLGMLESNETAGVEVGLLPNNLKLASDPKTRKEQVARLARLLVSDDAQARRIAAKLLGRSDDLNLVPELIFALSDSDPYVPMIAEEGLRLLSRRLTAGKLGVSPSLEQREAAEEYWKAWYLELRPDYIFVRR